MHPKIILESWIERDVALVVAEEVQLDFVGARTSQIKIAEPIAVWRNRRRVRHTVCIVPARCFRFRKARSALQLACEGSRVSDFDI